MSEAAAAPVVFKKRNRSASRSKKRTRTIKRDVAPEQKEDEALSDGETQVFKKTKLQRRGLSVADTKQDRKKDEGINSVQYASAGAKIKQVKDSMTVRITDSNTARQAKAEATKGLVVDEETGKTVYMGQMQKIGLVHSKKAGPLKSVANLKTTVVFDYAPDICKDYKETGYCGYGDSCKFMHDRGDYKTGWQIEREWEAEQKKKREALEKGLTINTGDDDDLGEYYIDSDEEEELPFACSICRDHFVNPVVTKCKHYFCEDCAVAAYKKDHRCHVCKEPTGGQFNVAHDILKKAGAE